MINSKTHQHAKLYFLFFAILGFSLEGLAKSSKSIDTVDVSARVKVMRVNSPIGNTNTVVYLGDNSNLLIDPNFNQTQALIWNELNGYGIEKISHIAISHTHRDHIDQIAEFTDPKTRVVVSHAQKALLIENQLIKQSQPTALVNTTQAMTLAIKPDSIKIIALPNLTAHTQGDVIFHFESDRAVYLGDYLFTHGYPIIDKAIGNINGYFSNLDYILSQFKRVTESDSIRFIPGHSSIAPAPIEIYSLLQLENRFKLLKQSVCYIKQQQKNGLPVKRLKGDGLGEKYRSIKQGAVFVKEDQWIDYVYAQTVRFC